MKFSKLMRPHSITKVHGSGVIHGHIYIVIVIKNIRATYSVDLHVFNLIRESTIMSIWV